jgi:hypothetical protein
LICENLHLKRKKNNVSVNQVSKLAQTPKKTLHYKELLGWLKVQLRHPCLSCIVFT